MSAPALAQNGPDTLTVGDLRFTLKPSQRRRTLQITIERNGDLLLSGPPGVARQRLRDFVLEKRYWIYTKLAEKDRLQRRVSPRQFVDGEGFLYLGRSHRLRLVDQQEVALKLHRGRFLLRRDPPGRAGSERETLIRWYREHAHAWLWARAQDYLARMEVDPAGIKVRELGYRWGSCGKGGWLYFHWKTILLPAPIAEYVLVHELAHLHEPHHTPAFWQRVERAMPDYEQRKGWLAEQGMDVEGI